MSYGLRGLDGHVYGLGFGPTPPVWENCDPKDVACVLRNTLASNAYQEAMNVAQAQNNRAQCEANARNAGSPGQYAEVMASCAAAYAQQSQPDVPTLVLTPPAPGPAYQPPVPNPSVPGYVPPSVVPRGGSLSFTTSRGSLAMQVGDTWLVSITGATPNATVTVSGSGAGGPFAGSSMGTTDGAGNFSKSGAVGAGEIGAWNETWAVGGATSGSVSFTVTQALAGGTPGSGTPAGGRAPSGSTVGGFDLSKIPVWGWAVAAGVALFAFGGGRGR